MNKTLEERFDEKFGEMTISEDNHIDGVWMPEGKMKEGVLPIFNSKAIKDFIRQEIQAFSDEIVLEEYECPENKESCESCNTRKTITAFFKHKKHQALLDRGIK